MRRLHGRVKKTKRWRGANPRPVVLNDSALPVHHSDMLYFSPLCDNMIYYLNADLCFEIVLTFQRLTPTSLRPVGLSLRYIIYELKGVFFTRTHVYKFVFFTHNAFIGKKKDNMNRLQLITNKLYKEEYEMFRTAETVNMVRQ